MKRGVCPLNEAIFFQHHTVVEDDLDDYQHVNNLRYLQWTLRAASGHSKQVGWTSQRYRELGAGWIVRSHQITYKLAARLGDEVVIKTWIADLERFSSLRKYEIRLAKDQRLCAVAETRWVFIDFTTQKPVAVPEDVRQAFTVLS